MTTLNQGRNEIRFNNSGGKCLLENWVEERAVSDIDPQDLNAERTSGAEMFKEGHKGLLNIGMDQNVEKLTTFKDSYRPPQGPNVRQRGSKSEMLEKMLYEKISQDVHNEFNAPPENIEYVSVTQQDFNRPNFVPTKPKPTQPHDYVSEQPVSFWTEHKEKLHGRTQIKTMDTPFRRNAAFSEPIDEYWDQPKPHESDMVPNM